MARSSLTSQIMVLAGTFAFGCVNQPAPTAETSSSKSTAPLASSSHSMEGAVILRGTFLAGFLAIDEERGLTTLIGIPADQIAGLIDCGGTGEAEAHDLPGVLKPSGAFKWLLKNQETPVAVWHLVSDDVCGVLGTTAPYAEGTARLRYTDNDVEFPIEPGGNASTLRAVGRVTVTGTGEARRYHAFLHSIVPPGGTTFQDIRVIRETIRLH